MSNFPSASLYGVPQAPNPQLDSALRNFWGAQAQEIDAMTTSPNEFKANNLPLARIKKIMKSGGCHGTRPGAQAGQPGGPPRVRPPWAVLPRRLVTPPPRGPAPPQTRT